MNHNETRPPRGCLHEPARNVSNPRSMKAIVVALVALLGGLAVTATRAHAAPPAHVVYVNFSDGNTVLTPGTEDASKDQSSICAGPWPEWKGRESSKPALLGKLAK